MFNRKKTLIGVAALFAAAFMSSFLLTDLTLADSDGYEGPFGFGEFVSPEDVHEYNDRPSIFPDGAFLPVGSGTVAQGENVFAQKCAQCHGSSGNEGPFPVLVGREHLGVDPESDQTAPVKAIGNYWPYATTLWDYIMRAMPFDSPGSLSADETYSVVAWLLYRNDIVSSDFEANEDTLSRVKMPAEDVFVPDPRPWPQVQ